MWNFFKSLSLLLSLTPVMPIGVAHSKGVSTKRIGDKKPVTDDYVIFNIDVQRAAPSEDKKTSLDGMIEVLLDGMPIIVYRYVEAEKMPPSFSTVLAKNVLRQGVNKFQLRFAPSVIALNTTFTIRHSIATTDGDIRDEKQVVNSGKGLRIVDLDLAILPTNALSALALSSSPVVVDAKVKQNLIRALENKRSLFKPDAAQLLWDRFKGSKADVPPEWTVVAKSLSLPPLRNVSDFDFFPATSSSVVLVRPKIGFPTFLAGPITGAQGPAEMMIAMMQNKLLTTAYFYRKSDGSWVELN